MPVPPPPNSNESIGILLCNLGTPDAPTPAAVRRYLAEFLSDRRVVPMPPLLWQPILQTLILPRRKKSSAHKYQKIWTDEGSPLLVHTRKQALMLRGWLGEAGVRNVEVAIGMRYGNPGIVAQLERWHQEGIRHALVVPLYPQYSATTMASVEDVIQTWGRTTPSFELRCTPSFPTDEGYLQALERSVTQHWMAHGRAEKLVMSFHGIPQRNVDQGDPYQQQCLHTAQALAQRLELKPHQYCTTFQSRFGRLPWIQPYTQPTVEQMAKEGIKTIDIICPGFISDCIETLEEVDMEIRQAFLAWGGQEFRYIPCLNEQPAWISALRDWVIAHLQDWRQPVAGPITTPAFPTATRPALRPASRTSPSARPRP